MDKRPPLTIDISPKDFMDFYWLKEELIDFCRTHGLSGTGGKEEIAERIVYFLKTGKELKETRPVSRKPSTGRLFIALNAPLTSNYNSGERVRDFFKQQIGSHFKFTVGFMRFCNENPNKTFSDAIDFWLEEHEKKKDKNYKPKISGQFEYNQYIRDIMADNEDLSLKDAIKCWKAKRSQRGDNKYTREDLNFLDKPD